MSLLHGQDCLAPHLRVKDINNKKEVMNMRKLIVLPVFILAFALFSTCVIANAPSVTWFIYPNTTNENISTRVHQGDNINVAWFITGGCYWHNVSFYVADNCWYSGQFPPSHLIYSGFFTGGQWSPVGIPTTNMGVCINETTAGHQGAHMGYLIVRDTCNETTNEVYPYSQFFNVYPYQEQNYSNGTVYENGTYSNESINYNATLSISPATGYYDTDFLFSMNLTNASITYYPLNVTIFTDSVPSSFLTNQNYLSLHFNHFAIGNHWAYFTVRDGLGNAWVSNTGYFDITSEYSYYFHAQTCRATSGSNYGSLICHLNFTIPSDCMNITSEAIASNQLMDDEGLNASASFSRWACNPNTDNYGSCDQQYESCNWANMNTPAEKEYFNYVGGQMATGDFISTLPQGCLIGNEATFNLTGLLLVRCFSKIESGIHIDDENTTCELSRDCYNSAQMIEVMPDCSWIITYCEGGCVDGGCVAERPPQTGPSDRDIDVGGINVSLSLVCIIAVVALAIYAESKTKGTGGVVFAGVVVIGIIVLAWKGIIPVWIPVIGGVLIAVIFAYLGRKGVKG